jgi:hypothetical protein
MHAYKINDFETYNRMQKDIGNVAGIYQLRLLNPDDTTFKPLQRLLSVDNCGVLYIGASLSLPDRVASLRKGVCAAYKVVYTDHSVHPCGMKLKDRTRMREFCGFESLCVVVEPCGGSPEDFESYKGHYKLEWDQLQKYCMEFGEYPPLNG